NGIVDDHLAQSRLHSHWMRATANPVGQHDVEQGGIDGGIFSPQKFGGRVHIHFGEHSLDVRGSEDDAVAGDALFRLGVANGGSRPAVAVPIPAGSAVASAKDA